MSATHGSGEAGTSGDAGHEELLTFLSRPDSYPDPTLHVERLETHISWIFLTDRHAYKLKKPVRHDFIDYSTGPLRRSACEREVQLNRRLAPAVYLGVVPVTRDRRGRLRLGGAGTPVDWLVQMRRLPADHSLDALIRSGRLSPADVDLLADRLVRFYRELPPLPVKSETYRRAIHTHVVNNFRELRRTEHGLPAGLVWRSHAAQLRLLELYPDLWNDRVCDGRVIEGHGDLRPEHVYFVPNPVLIDAIEFNAELRQIDVLDEIGFLAMECSALDAAWVGQRILARYISATGDAPAELVLRFYEAYRACVRAKVHALRATQETPPAGDLDHARAMSYLSWANKSLAEWATPLLIVVHGLSGTGKSELATRWSESLGCQLLQTDEIRRETIASRNLAEPSNSAAPCSFAASSNSAAPHDSAAPAGYGEGLYADAQRAAVYETMFRRATESLRDGVSVVLDGTFLSRDLRGRARSIAESTGAEFLRVHCRCPIRVAAERVESRRLQGLRHGRVSSEIAPHWLERQSQDEQADDANDLPHCSLDTTAPLGELLDAVYDQLRRRHPLRTETAAVA